MPVLTHGSKRSRLLTVSAAFLSVFATYLSVAPHATARPSGAIALPHPAHGQQALRLLGDNLGKAAAGNGWTAAKLRDVLSTDSTAWVDGGGHVFYKDPGAGAGPSTTGEGIAPFPLPQTFLLHSRATSTHKIFLDFDGTNVSNTAWNVPANQGGPGLPNGNYEGYSLDASAAFSDAEKEEIQKIWQRVSEDYAPFDVDVTTQDPGEAALDRSDANDQAFGTRALITESAQAVQTLCQSQCGGLAYVGVFNQASDAGEAHSFRQPAWVFASTLNNSDTKAISEATSHEVGHNFGLSHDGRTTPAEGYYTGHDPWAPIMGTGYTEPLVQWSKGEYANANNKEDDLSIIANGGAPVVTDEAGDTVATAAGAIPAKAYIASPTDKDVFSLGTCSGAVTLTATGAPPSQDLDIKLDLLNAQGTQVATDNPASAFVSIDSISGVNASITQNNLAAGTYYARVDGVGNGNATTGYTDYGSLGQYTLTKTGCNGQSAPSVPQNVTVTPAADGMSATVTWTAPASNGGSAITGYLVGRTGAATVDNGTTLTKTWTGLTPGQAYTFTVAAKNAVGTGPAASVNATMPTQNTPPTVPTNLVVTPAANGTSATVTWTAPASNGGSAITGYLVGRTGAPTVDNGTTLTKTWTGLTPGQAYTFTVAAKNAVGTGPAASMNATMPTPNTVPSAPTNLAVAPAANGTSATVTWSPPASNGGSAVTGYVLGRTGGAPVNLGPVGTFSWTGLTPGATYTFTVAAKNAVGTGAGASRTVTLTVTSPPPPPPPPPGVATVPSAPRMGRAHNGVPGGRSTARVNWGSPDNAGGRGGPITGYIIIAYQMNAAGDVVDTFNSDVLASRLRHVNVLLDPGLYRFRVVAVNAIGRSPVSRKSNLVVAR